MISSIALAAALWPAPVTQHCQSIPENVVVVGVALDTHNDFLYCEYFTVPDKNHLHVDYVKDSKPFASKQLDYTNSQITPTVKQIDGRSGELREAELIASKFVMRYQENNADKLNSVTFSAKDVDVVDAGFDNFVKAHWDELVSEKPMSINFGSTVHQKIIPLRIAASPIKKCQVNSTNPAATYCFTVAIDNVILRALISNIKISYDASRRLVQFNGVVNIQSDAKESQTAIINYFYKTDYVDSPIKTPAS